MKSSRDILIMLNDVQHSTSIDIVTIPIGSYLRINNELKSTQRIHMYKGVYNQRSVAITGLHTYV